MSRGWCGSTREFVLVAVAYVLGNVALLEYLLSHLPGAGA